MKNHNNDEQSLFSCGGLYSQQKSDTSTFSPSHRHENAVDTECFNPHTSSVTDETVPPYFEGMEYQPEQYRNEEVHVEQPLITSEDKQKSAENEVLDEAIAINARKPIFIMSAVIFVLAAAVIGMGVHIYKDKKNHEKMIEEARKNAVREYLFGDDSPYSIYIDEDELQSSVIGSVDTIVDFHEEDFIKMPDVVGKDSDEAYDILSDCGFNVIISDRGNSVKSEYEVVSQYPKAGDYAMNGDAVTIYVE